MLKRRNEEKRYKEGTTQNLYMYTIPSTDNKHLHFKLKETDVSVRHECQN